MKDKPFIASGLKFSCKRCSSCCRYDAGYVYLSETDIEKLALFMEMERESFIGLYCRRVEDRHLRSVLSLKEKSNKDCIFWESRGDAPNEGGGCSVYGARPIQCRIFPFWKSIVASEETWKIAATGCPGMNQGKLYSEEEISNIISQGGEI